MLDIMTDHGDVISKWNPEMNAWFTENVIKKTIYDAKLKVVSIPSDYPKAIRIKLQKFTKSLQDSLGKELDVILAMKEFKDETEQQKAMQVLAKTDAAKSYAFSQIYAVSAQYCGVEVQNLLATYQSRAAKIIALGHYYYQQGIQAKIGDRDLSQSGEALSAGLKEMTDKLEVAHQTASQQQLDKKCREASQALGSLTYLYGNH